MRFLVLFALLTSTAAMADWRDSPNRVLSRELMNRLEGRPSIPNLRNVQNFQLVEEVEGRMRFEPDQPDRPGRVSLHCSGSWLVMDYISAYGEVMTARAEFGEYAQCMDQIDFTQSYVNDVYRPQLFAICGRWDRVVYYAVDPIDGISVHRSEEVGNYDRCKGMAQDFTRRNS